MEGYTLTIQDVFEKYDYGDLFQIEGLVGTVFYVANGELYVKESSYSEEDKSITELWTLKWICTSKFRLVVQENTTEIFPALEAPSRIKNGETVYCAYEGFTYTFSGTNSSVKIALLLYGTWYTKTTTYVPKGENKDEKDR